MYLETIQLVAGYGKKQVLNGVSLGVEKGEVVTLFGHNGAGKSTTLQVISGLRKSWSGRIVLDGEDIAGKDVAENVKNGVSLVPQGRAFFDDLSVEENLKMAGYTLRSRSLIRERSLGVYQSFPRLQERQSQFAGTLSGGEQRMLSVGMALIMNPKVMLLDEPTFGLSPLLATELMHKIAEISGNFGSSVLLVQDSITKSLSVCNRGYIMKNGRVVYEGAKKMLASMTGEELFSFF
jgi:branched-chain amino acid transport system ATP-binding protein